MTCNYLITSGDRIGQHCGGHGIYVNGKKIRCEGCKDRLWPVERFACRRTMFMGLREGQACGKTTVFADGICSVCRKTGAVSNILAHADESDLTSPTRLWGPVVRLADKVPFSCDGDEESVKPFSSMAQCLKGGLIRADVFAERTGHVDKTIDGGLSGVETQSIETVYTLERYEGREIDAYGTRLISEQHYDSFSKAIDDCVVFEMRNYGETLEMRNCGSTLEQVIENGKKIAKAPYVFEFVGRTIGGFITYKVRKSTGKPAETVPIPEAIRKETLKNDFFAAGDDDGDEVQDDDSKDEDYVPTGSSDEESLECGSVDTRSETTKQINKERCDKCGGAADDWLSTNPDDKNDNRVDWYCMACKMDEEERRCGLDDNRNDVEDAKHLLGNDPACEVCGQKDADERVVFAGSDVTHWYCKQCAYEETIRRQEKQCEFVHPDGDRCDKRASQGTDLCDYHTDTLCRRCGKGEALDFVYHNGCLRAACVDCITEINNEKEAQRQKEVGLDMEADMYLNCQHANKDETRRREQPIGETMTWLSVDMHTPDKTRTIFVIDSWNRKPDEDPSDRGHEAENFLSFRLAVWCETQNMWVTNGEDQKVRFRHFCYLTFPRQVSDVGFMLDGMHLNRKH